MQLSLLTGTCLVNEGRCTLKHSVENLGLAAKWLWSFSSLSSYKKLNLGGDWLKTKQHFLPTEQIRSIFLWRMLEHSYILKMTAFQFASSKNFHSHMSLLQLGIKQVSLFPQEIFLHHVSICKFFLWSMKLTFISIEVIILHLNFWYFEWYMNRSLGLRKMPTLFLFTQKYNNNIDHQTTHGLASSCLAVYSMSTTIRFIKHRMKS